jgi:hypothetical protein
LPGVPDTWNELLYVSLLKYGKGAWKTWAYAAPTFHTEGEFDVQQDTDTLVTFSIYVSYWKIHLKGVMSYYSLIRMTIFSNDPLDCIVKVYMYGVWEFDLCWSHFLEGFCL